MSSLERSLELLDGYCRAVGASSASEENVVGCLQYMDTLEAELDATIGVLNIRNDLQRKTLERTKLHCEQKLRSVDAKLAQKAKQDATGKSDEHVVAGEESHYQDESKMKAIQFELISRGYAEDMDNEAEREALQKEIDSLNQRCTQLRSEIALFHDLPPSIPEAKAILLKLQNRRN
ncbi:hypothetical protein RvY_01423 [Ramazzottius varieornatus]|uniref:Uncharacterized protein n=1 Tax=Ramazzottius varieornatus TaxID=947166 RepID=A0A1D1UND1_RAMVA|nr:hypothetical protein RvY_01423 [Ramazzottius varieornatus]